jgi:biopolymer transport protein ExbB
MTGEMTFREIMAISIVLPIILGLSIVCAAVVLERLVSYLRYAGGGNKKALDRIRIYLKNGNVNEAKKEANKAGGFVGKAYMAQLEAVGLPRNEREGLVIFYHQKYQELLNRRLWIFGTLSFICPLIGLFGTVLGVMTAFGDLAISGSGGPTIVAAGISEALWATAAGIGLAIAAAVLYNMFNIWMKGSLHKADMFGQEMIFLTSGGTARGKVHV